MRHHCPVCGNKVEMHITYEGQIILFNKEGNFHSCAKDARRSGAVHKGRSLSKKKGG